jgi:hypothetical protein
VTKLMNQQEVRRLLGLQLMRLMRGSNAVGAAAVVLCAASVMLLENWNGARGVVLLQQLANWNTGVLGGKASLVTQCAQGNDAACDALVSDPGAVAALQNIDAKNPQVPCFRSENPSLSEARHKRTCTKHARTRDLENRAGVRREAPAQGCEAGEEI